MQLTGGGVVLICCAIASGANAMPAASATISG
jgi:hypothetical protein